MAQLLSEEASPVAEQVSHIGSDNLEVDLGESSGELHLSLRKKGNSLEDIEAHYSLDVMKRNGRWQYVVPEILSCISDRLSMPDFIRFRSVCRSWRSAPSFRSNITNFDKEKPWVLIYGLEQKHHDHCILLQLLSHNHCLLKLPVLSGTTVLASMAGWLLWRNGNHLFFYNPFSLQGFQLPKHPLSFKPLTKQEATFSSVPTSPYCIVFIVNDKEGSKLEISWCRPFEKSWSVKVVDFGAWLTSEWSCGLYCSCRRFGEEFKCMHCDEVVIWQPSGWMSYDIERKGFRGGGILMDDGKSWWSELDEMDLDDLLCGLVKKDSVISFCSFNSTGVDSYDLSPAEFRIKSSRESAEGTGSVKAAWMEPTFPWK